MNLNRTIFRWCIILISITCLLVCNIAKTANAQVNKEFNKPIAVFPFQSLAGGIIMVKATIDNYPDSLHLIFDTGNTGFSLDSATASNLGLKITPTDRTVRGIAGVKQAFFTYQHQVNFPGFTTDNFDFHISDYALFEQVYGIKIDGIIGYSFFNKYVVKINYDTRLIECYAPANFAYPKRGYFLPTKLYRYPVNTAILQEEFIVSSNSIFDIGAGLNYLVSSKLINDVNLFSPGKKYFKTQVEGLGGKKLIDITVLKKMNLGKFRFRNVPVHIFDDEFDILNYPSLGGIIGSDLLRRFNMIINYAEEKIHLTPNSHFRDPFDYHYSGISFYVVDGMVTIVDIVPNSPGALFGFKEDDVIIAINGKLVTDLKFLKDNLELKRLRHELSVIRNNQFLSLPIKLINIKK